jgi:hypothetical protein
MIGGAAVALFSTQLIARSPEVEVGRTGLLGAAWGLWYGLTVGWMYFNYPDWMLAYLVDAEKVPLVPTYVLFVAMLALHGALAALAAAVLVQRKKVALGWALLGGILVAQFSIMALQFDSYTHIGTFAEYWAHQAKPVDQVPRAQTGMTVAGLLATPVALGILAMRFIKGRKAARGAG